MSEATTAALSGARRFKHLKRGSIYRMIGEATIQASKGSLSDGDLVVVYQGESDGSTYRMIGAAIIQASNGSLSDGDPVVVYQGESDGAIWARAVAEFFDGRFEELEPAVNVPITDAMVEVMLRTYYKDDPYVSVDELLKDRRCVVEAHNALAAALAVRPPDPRNEAIRLLRAHVQQFSSASDQARAVLDATKHFARETM